MPVPLDVTIEGSPGFHDLEIRPARQSQPDGVGRHLTFILESLLLDEPEEAPRRGAPGAQGLGDMAAPGPSARAEGPAAGKDDGERVLWDLSEGMGALEGPAPEIGLADPFRWIVSRRSRLVIEAPVARHATLRIDYRCPVAGQRAILRINDDPAQFLRLDTGALTDRFRLDVPVRLRQGRNAVELLLSATTREAAGLRDLGDAGRGRLDPLILGGRCGAAPGIPMPGPQVAPDDGAMAAARARGCRRPASPIGPTAQKETAPGLPRTPSIIPRGARFSASGCRPRRCRGPWSRARTAGR